MLVIETPQCVALVYLLHVEKSESLFTLNILAMVIIIFRLTQWFSSFLTSLHPFNTCSKTALKQLTIK